MKALYQTKALRMTKVRVLRAARAMLWGVRTVRRRVRLMRVWLVKLFLFRRKRFRKIGFAALGIRGRE